MQVYTTAGSKIAVLWRSELFQNFQPGIWIRVADSVAPGVVEHAGNRLPHCGALFRVKRSHLSRFFAFIIPPPL